MMKILSIVLAVAGLGFLVVSFMEHSPAWSAATMCIFAATMIIVGKRKKSV